MSSQPAPATAATPVEDSNEAYCESLRAERNRLWEKVTPVTSTRWDLTRYEKADDAYERACRHYGITPVPATADHFPNMKAAR